MVGFYRHAVFLRFEDSSEPLQLHLCDNLTWTFQYTVPMREYPTERDINGTPRSVQEPVEMTPLSSFLSSLQQGFTKELAMGGARKCTRIFVACF